MTDLDPAPVPAAPKRKLYFVARYFMCAKRSYYPGEHFDAETLIQRDMPLDERAALQERGALEERDAEPKPAALTPLSEFTAAVLPSEEDAKATEEDPPEA